MNLEPVALIMQALNGLQLRSSATAQNIANANTVGYRPVEVRFEDALGRPSLGPPRVRARSDIVPGGMRLDQELLTATATASRYGALATLLTRRMQMDHLVATEGRA
jgi:flagellar basal-body rod protein FlgB